MKRTSHSEDATVPITPFQGDAFSSCLMPSMLVYKQPALIRVHRRSGVSQM